MRWLRRALITLFATYALYLVAGNAFLNTPLGARALNATNSSRPATNAMAIASSAVREGSQGCAGGGVFDGIRLVRGAGLACAGDSVTNTR